MNNKFPPSDSAAERRMHLMKILIYGDGYFGADMAWGFEELGHDVRLLGSPQTVEQLEALLSGNDDASLLMTLGSPSYFKEPLLKYLAARPRSAMKYVHWDTDGITWLQIEMAHIHQFGPEAVFTVCPDMLELLRSNNIRSEMLYYAYCPLFHHPADPAPLINGQISFVGNAYTNVLDKYPGHYRHLSMNVLFKPLLENGTRIDFYGDTPIRQVIKPCTILMCLLSGYMEPVPITKSIKSTAVLLSISSRKIMSIA
jgi:hypothetical protein